MGERKKGTPGAPDRTETYMKARGRKTIKLIKYKDPYSESHEVIDVF